MTNIKIASISPLSKKKAETYKESLLRHLEEVSPDLSDSSPVVTFVFSVSAQGISYQVLTDNSTLEVVGALETVKTFFIYDSTEGE